MTDRSELISKILNTLLASDDIDEAILKLSDIITFVDLQTSLPQHSVSQAASFQELQVS